MASQPVAHAIFSCLLDHLPIRIYLRSPSSNFMEIYQIKEYGFGVQFHHDGLLRFQKKKGNCGKVDAISPCVRSR